MRNRSASHCTAFPLLNSAPPACLSIGILLQVERSKQAVFIHNVYEQIKLGKHYVSFERLASMTVNITVFWNMTVWNVVKIYATFRRINCLHFQGTRWRQYIPPKYQLTSTRLHGVTLYTALTLTEKSKQVVYLKQRQRLFSYAGRWFSGLESYYVFVQKSRSIYGICNKQTKVNWKILCFKSVRCSLNTTKFGSEVKGTPTDTFAGMGLKYTSTDILEWLIYFRCWKMNFLKCQPCKCTYLMWKQLSECV
jgi:hypothetical protein